MEQEKEMHCQHGCRGPKAAIKALSVVVLGVIVVVALLREKLVDDRSGIVSVSGRAQVFYQPDTADITLGVQVDKAPTAQQGLDELNKKVSGIIAAVAEKGVAREDIATRNYSLNTQYDYKDGATVAAGYNANQQIVIKVRGVGKDQSKISEVLSAASAAGSNQVVGVSFDASNIADLKQQALLSAIKDARAKSEALAEAAGLKLGEVKGWSEAPTSSPEVPVREFSALGMGGDSKAVSADVPVGTRDIAVEVSVEYEVK